MLRFMVFLLFLPFQVSGEPNLSRADLKGAELEHLPPPLVDEEFPLSEASIALGKKLFHDNALSVTNTVSCAFCHLPNEAFSDPSLQPWGVRPARTTRRHSMPLFNLAWKPGPFRWDGEEETLRAQILRPISDPIELGENLATLPEKLAQIEDYPDRFSNVFGDAEVTSDRLAIAIEHYLFSLVSVDSKFDQAQKGLTDLTKEEERGKVLFFQPFANGEEGGKASCAQCHPTPFFTDYRFHNNGLSPRRRDKGREEVTGQKKDRYQFATPSLRNIEVTAPYMHDGRFATLAEVVAHYSSGLHQSESLAPSLAQLPKRGLQLSTSDQKALVAFLKTLTDPQFLEDESFKKVDPFSKY